jgi:hypothetical protein
MGFLGKIFGGSKATPSYQDSTTKYNVPSWFHDYIEDNINSIRDITGDLSEVTADERIADFGPDEIRAFGMIRDQAGQSSPYLDKAMQNLSDLQQRAFEGVDQSQLDTYMNPYQQNVIDTTKRELVRDADMQRERLGSQAAQAGAFGGSRHAILEAENERNLGQRLSDVQYQGSADAYNNALSSAFQRDQQAANAATQLGNFASIKQNIQNTDASTLADVGQSIRGLDQAKLDWTYENPLQQAYNFQNALNSVPWQSYGYTGTGMQTQNTPSSGWGSKLLGTAAGS